MVTLTFEFTLLLTEWLFQNKGFFYIFATKHSKISGEEYATVEEDAYAEKLLIWQLADETHTHTGYTGYVITHASLISKQQCIAYDLQILGFLFRKTPNNCVNILNVNMDM